MGTTVSYLPVLPITRAGVILNAPVIGMPGIYSEELRCRINLHWNGK